jgi:hypothetical protein
MLAFSRQEISDSPLHIASMLGLYQLALSGLQLGGGEKWRNSFSTSCLWLNSSSCSCFSWT